MHPTAPAPLHFTLGTAVCSAVILRSHISSSPTVCGQRSGFGVRNGHSAVCPDPLIGLPMPLALQYGHLLEPCMTLGLPVQVLRKASPPRSQLPKEEVWPHQPAQAQEEDQVEKRGQHLAGWTWAQWQ